MFAISIFSTLIPNAFSIQNQNNSLSFYEDICTDGSCTITTCYNHQPCKISTDSKTTPRDDASQSSYNSLFW